MVILWENELRKSCRRCDHAKERLCFACATISWREAGWFLGVPGGKVENGETPEECLARELAEELDIRTRIGEKCAESLHQYDHGSFRVVAYFVDCIGGEPRPSVNDRLEWVEIDDIHEYQLLPADISILASLQKLKELGRGELY